MTLLFEPPAKFEGLPESAFGVFVIEERDARRAAIIEAFHPPLRALGEDLVRRLSPEDEEQSERTEYRLHAHLPRLDWPRGYEPFCTWLALSREAHGYQAGPQLNVGVHADHVAVRLGWDTGADSFGRFEFLCRRGDLGRQLVAHAAEAGLRFRVYAAASWPQGSRCVFESDSDVEGTFDEVRRRGVWWELGRRYELPEWMRFVCSKELGSEASRIFAGLMPIYDRIVGDPHPGE